MDISFYSYLSSRPCSVPLRLEDSDFLMNDKQPYIDEIASELTATAGIASAMLKGDVAVDTLTLLDACCVLGLLEHAYLRDQDARARTSLLKDFYSREGQLVAAAIEHDMSLSDVLDVRPTGDGGLVVNSLRLHRLVELSGLAILGDRAKRELEALYARNLDSMRSNRESFAGLSGMLKMLRDTYKSLRLPKEHVVFSFLDAAIELS